ncbi:hypothetical protein CKAN_00484200 [Cinnamomum micranthum f. kanehirae]|uniref:Uncharacterized protein n=1 Tax=Cinnamomum micranthum f. kanehirae TaxID=337451 RepID=A0A3S3M3F3_9MAGN|nr:hypothetical protein CKAN_00484200 [Cinnamomum micranthum f. kanehirae]
MEKESVSKVLLNPHKVYDFVSDLKKYGVEFWQVWRSSSSSSSSYLSSSSLVSKNPFLLQLQNSDFFIVTGSTSSLEEAKEGEKATQEVPSGLEEWPELGPA